MGSFGVVSLFTRVLIGAIMEFIKKQFTSESTVLFQHVTTTKYFQFEGTFYRQTYIRSPAISNFYVEVFE